MGSRPLQAGWVGLVFFPYTEEIGCEGHGATPVREHVTGFITAYSYY